VTDAQARAERFADLFRAVYLTFHRRDGHPADRRRTLVWLTAQGHERFERMTAWQARRKPGASRQEIERQTLDYMATMPAWRDHPRVAANRAS
jgi:DNA-binding MarR family transcriptional regulator